MNSYFIYPGLKGNEIIVLDLHIVQINPEYMPNVKVNVSKNMKN
jgi:hypothetical protein